MAYHEAFWVTVGTAAPVIALAQIVVMQRVTSLTFKDWTDRPFLPMIGMAILSGCLFGISFAGYALSEALDALRIEQDGDLGASSYVNAAFIALLATSLITELARVYHQDVRPRD